MIIIQVFAVYVFNINNFTMIIYTFPKRAIEMMLAISLILVNGYFLVDMIYYYIEMKNAIVIRTNKQTYYKIIICLERMIEGSISIQNHSLLVF